MYKTSNGLDNESTGNGVMTHPYAHPQHMKVVIHLIVYVIDVGAILD
jgi:hypothetical protein